MSLGSKRSFTLIELLVVVAILGVLAAAVVIVLNPTELLAQARDAQRFSDMDTLSKSINLYQVASGTLPGSPNTVYVSLLDSSPTCVDWNLPALPAGDTYACSATPKAPNGSGWIPINSITSSGNSLAALPVDPVNSSSTGLYYTYAVSGNSYEITAILESQKYRYQEQQSPSSQIYPGLLAAGTSFSISPLFNPSGLVGYWNLDEGSGTTANDVSGSGNTGTWQGSAAYVTGKLGPYAAYFSDATGTYIGLNTTSSLESTSVTLSEWEQMPVNAINSGYTYTGTPLDDGYDMIIDNSTNVDWNVYNTSTRYEVTYHGTSAGVWYFLVGTYNGSTLTFYVNGNQVGAIPATLTYTSPSFAIGEPHSGINQPYEIDDVRIYNRALSTAEVQALYNIQH